MHKKGAAKATQNQRSIAVRGSTAPAFHRKSTGLSTDGTIHAMRARVQVAQMHSCAAARYDNAMRPTRASAMAMQPGRAS